MASLPTPPLDAAPAVTGPPSAEGELRPAVAGRLLHELWRSRADGALSLEDGARVRRFFFQGGVPAAWQEDGVAAPEGALAPFA